MNKQIFEKDFFGRKLIVETGEIAKQAGGSVLIRYGDTAILSTSTASKVARDIDFFPLMVLFEEKLYSVGKIPGGFLRREGRPSEHATLTARLIDRPIRPLFPEGFRNEVQVVNTVLSVDQDSPSEVAAMFGSSLSLCISDIPFDGPIAGVHVGRVNGNYIVNPTVEQNELSDIQLTVAGTKDAINMVEAGAKEVSEADMLEAILIGHEAIKELIVFQEEIIKECGKEKREIAVFEVDASIQNEVEDLTKAKMAEALLIKEKLLRYGTIDDIKQEVMEIFENREYESDEQKAGILKQVKEAVNTVEKDEFRKLITVDKIRPDGRKIDELRPLNSQIDILARVHGSALFTRGETQVLSVCTLGAMGDSQIIDDVTIEDGKRFMHHYNFPPFSVGETGRMGAPGRREIGHGALGERALAQVLPTEEEFPYAIRVVSEVLESNGSSSQASICAGTMALMAAGVPIKQPVAGIAMGLIMQDENYTVLTDIQGMEDHLGDMDFKVAGTRDGICALQMDIKIAGLSKAILEEALAQAKVGRMQILDNMEATIDKPRDDVGEYAPKVHTMYIDVDKIRDVIGPGGKQINEIIANSNDVKIDIEQDGRVSIYHFNRESINIAVEMIENIVKVAKVGEVYEGVVTRIEKFGAFLELFKGTEALLHVSRIAHERVEKPEDVLKMGDKLEVKVIEIDEKGRVAVSRKALLPKPENFKENNDKDNKDKKDVSKPKVRKNYFSK